jgi:hypothetical protein
MSVAPGRVRSRTSSSVALPDEARPSIRQSSWHLVTAIAGSAARATDTGLRALRYARLTTAIFKHILSWMRTAAGRGSGVILDDARARPRPGGRWPQRLRYHRVIP